MIDIHAHILPEVDDGADDMEDSCLMAELAEESGVETIICTPHSNIEGICDNYWDAGMAGRVEQLQRELENRQIPVSVLPGMEIYGTEDVPDKIKAGKLISLNFTKYYLIEFGFQKSNLWMTKILARVRDLGLTPVVAHPERYECVQRDLETAQLWTDMGCQLQINKGSLFGKFGRGAWKAAGELLYQDLVSYVASDAHSPYRRTTYMGEAYDFLCEEFSKKLADQVLIENPRKLVQSEKTEFIVPGQ